MLTIGSEAFRSDFEKWLKKAGSEPLMVSGDRGSDVVIVSAHEYSSLKTSQMLRRNLAASR